MLIEHNFVSCAAIAVQL